MHLYSLSDRISFLFTHVPVSLACFSSIFPPFSMRHQTKPGSKFIIYQVALKFMVLKGWIRLAASTLSLVWVLRATEIVSQIGLIMFGPGDAWGFISLPRNCFVCISRQRLADILKRCYSLCLFQVVRVIHFCVCVQALKMNTRPFSSGPSLLYPPQMMEHTHMHFPWRPKESS